MTRLSAHFNSREFACHDGTPAPAHSIDELRQLCQRYLEPLRTQFGPVRIVSGYRHPRYNAAVGGAPASYHIYQQRRWGTAADVKPARGTPRQWYEALDRLAPGGLGYYSTHVHVDNRVGRARW